MRSSALLIKAAAYEIWAEDGRSKMGLSAIGTQAFAIHCVRCEVLEQRNCIPSGGAYAIADGGVPRPTLSSPDFTLSNDQLLSFCYYRPSALSDLVIYATHNGKRDEVRVISAIKNSNTFV